MGYSRLLKVPILVPIERYSQYRSRRKNKYIKNMWPVMVQFRSVSSKGSWRRKKKMGDRRIAVKPKFADDDYVGRPKIAPFLKPERNWMKPRI